jgi:hypothetical protein
MLYQRVHRVFPRRHPVLTGAGLLVISVWLWNGWYEAVAITALAGLLMFANHRRRALAIRDAGLRARAEYEHRLSLYGDPRGMFGRYPPVQAGWFPDPQSRCRIRYFDGAIWTGHTVAR